MARLVFTLQSMVRDDGCPDILKRKSELDGLITALLPSEIRFLKQRLTSWTFIHDFVPELPIEIQIRITDFLDLLDLINIRNVSRKWYRSWSHVKICNKLMKRFFRSAFEDSYLQLPDDDKVRTFLAAAERFQAMQLGEYSSMTVKRYQDVPSGKDGREVTLVLDRRYRAGRIAWAFECGIKVTDLRSGESQVFMTPDRGKAQVWSISEKWLIIMADDRVKSYVWPLFVTGRDFHTIRLPSLPTDVITMCNDSVGFVTITNEVFIWSGQSVPPGRCTLRQLYIKDPLPQHQEFRKMAVLFHPNEKTTVFVIFLACNKVYDGADIDGTVQWTVQKYVGDVLVDIYKLELPLQGLDYKSLDDIFWLNPSKVDDNGIYSLGPMFIDVASSFLELGCDHQWKRGSWSGGHRHLATYITFDIYEERLNVVSYHLPDDYKDSDDISLIIPHNGNRQYWKRLHLWNGQIFLPVLKALGPAMPCDPLHTVSVKRALVMTIISCDRLRNSPLEIRYFTGSGINKRTGQRKGSSTNRKVGLLYGWVGDTPPTYQPIEGSITAENDQKLEIRGDGTFVVLLGGWDYVVWNYDKSIMVAQQPE